MKKLCDGCMIYKDKKTVKIKCNLNPRHKQRQRFSTLSSYGPISPLIQGMLFQKFNPVYLPAFWRS